MLRGVRRCDNVDLALEVVRQKRDGGLMKARQFGWSWRAVGLMAWRKDSGLKDSDAWTAEAWFGLEGVDEVGVCHELPCCSTVSMPFQARNTQDSSVVFPNCEGSVHVQACHGQQAPNCKAQGSVCVCVCAFIFVPP